MSVPTVEARFDGRRIGEAMHDAEEVGVRAREDQQIVRHRHGFEYRAGSRYCPYGIRQISLTRSAYAFGLRKWRCGGAFADGARQSELGSVRQNLSHRPGCRRVRWRRRWRHWRVEVWTRRAVDIRAADADAWALHADARRRSRRGRVCARCPAGASDARGRWAGVARRSGGAPARRTSALAAAFAATCRPTAGLGERGSNGQEQHSRSHDELLQQHDSSMKGSPRNFDAVEAYGGPGGAVT